MDSSCLEEFLKDLSELVSNIENRSSSDDLEILKGKCQEALRTLLFISGEYGNEISSLDGMTRYMQIYYQEIHRETISARHHGGSDTLAVLSISQPGVSTTGMAGRPKFDIAGETLINLRSLGFTWVKMSKEKYGGLKCFMKYTPTA